MESGSKESKDIILLLVDSFDVRDNVRIRVCMLTANKAKGGQTKGKQSSKQPSVILYYCTPVRTTPLTCRDRRWRWSWAGRRRGGAGGGGS